MFCILGCIRLGWVVWGLGPGFSFETSRVGFRLGRGVGIGLG